MASFEKGHEKLPGCGRPKGAKNKATPIVREKLTEMTNTPEFWQKFITELMALEGREFTKNAIDIFKIIEPTLQSVAIEAKAGEEGSVLQKRLLELSQKADGSQ